MPDPARVAVFSPAIPPGRAGVTPYRLLAGVDPARYCLVAGEEPREPFVVPALPTRPHLLPAAPATALAPAEEPYGRAVRRAAGNLARARPLAAVFARVLEQEGCGTLAAFTGGDPAFLPAAALAARRRRARFVPVYLDDYGHQWRVLPGRHGRWVARLARLLEGPTLRQAAEVLVVSELLGEALQRRHGVRTTVMRVPAGEEFLDERPSLPWPLEPPAVHVVFAGSVYAAQADALRNLARALELLRRPGLAVHLYTDYPDFYLRELGILGPGVTPHEVVDNAALCALERQADVLFLPLAFRSPYPEIVRTSQPGKTGEYLASGRPVLAHVPADSFTARYLREHDCALVVSEDAPAALAAGLDRLCSDPDLRVRLVARALARAHQDFTPARARRAFWGAAAPGFLP